MGQNVYKPCVGDRDLKGGGGVYKLETFAKRSVWKIILGDWWFIGLIILHKTLGYGFNVVGWILPPPVCVSSTRIIHGEKEMQVMFKQC